MKKNSVYALIDCNNFFVSCERVFQPNLENKPVIVLSSNDGCAIARSNEAKALGIKMGEPFFKFRHLYEQKLISILSSNSQLYSDMSKRVMETIQYFCPFVEIYSIDEAFLDLNKLGITDYANFTHMLKSKILQWTGIPVSIGIASSKTLAKLASNIAKKNSGIFSLLEPTLLETTLYNTHVEDIWGIGNKISSKLRLKGIGNAKELSTAKPEFIRNNFSVTTEKTSLELQGISCIEFKTGDQNKSIIVSRSFGSDIFAIEHLEEALSIYASRACIKLRKQNLRTSSIEVFLNTNQFKRSNPQYKNSYQINLPYPTNNTSEIIKTAKEALNKIYKIGYYYHKIGIKICEFKDSTKQQIQIFNKPNYNKSDKIMSVIDKINKIIGNDSVFIAAQGTNHSWKNLSQNKSSEYTTKWNELAKVK